MPQGSIIGLEVLGFVFLLLLIGLSDESAHTRKKLASWCFAIFFTFFFVFNIMPDTALVKNGKVVRIGMVHAGMPARTISPESEDTLSYSYGFTEPRNEIEKKISLVFKCALMDSTGIKGYGFENTQAYHDLVYMPYGKLEKFLQAKINEMGVTSDIRQYLESEEDSIIAVIAEKIQSAGEPIGLRFVTEVAITAEGGDEE